MPSHTLVAETRTQTGKGAARQLRAKGLVPAVYYGAGHEPAGLAVSPKELVAALSTAYGRNVLLTLQIAGKEELAMVQDLQIHPVTRRPLHVDFYRVKTEEPILRHVPLAVEGRAKGVVAGGELAVVYRSVPLRAKPADFPAQVKVDVTNLDLGDHVKVKDLQLPEGVVVALPSERNVASISVPRKRKEEEEAAAAAPAAGGKGAPAKAPAKAAAKK